MQNLGIDESGSLLTKQIHSLQVYPNPTSNYIHFPIPQIESIILYNALGSPVALDLTNQQLMDVSKLNSGLYYGKAFTSKQVYRFHFVKM